MLVAGAGMAGLVAAARARELGAAPVVVEKGHRAGGSMLLSSGVVWRYRTFEEFRAQCPAGDETLQRLVHDRLDDALDWLESLGAPVTARETRNPLTVGRRFDPRGLTDMFVRAASDGGVHLQTPLLDTLERPMVLATGGFGGRLARELGLPLRANPWSDGDALNLARARGAEVTQGMDEFYGRAMPAPPAKWGEREFVDHAQLYGRHALVLDEHGEEVPVDPADWSETRLAQRIAARGGTAWYVVDEPALGKPTPYGTVAECIERARAVGGTVVERDDDRLAVHVVTAVTHTIGGLRIDERTRVLGEGRRPLDGLYAAGVDAGGIATGGYASGLAAALVLGLTAGESAVT